MKRDKRPDAAELKAFYDEVDAAAKPTDVPSKAPASADRNDAAPQPRPYVCPSCHRPLRSRKEPCGHCGYSGYIPMSETETNRVRAILFVVLFIAAVAVYFLTR